MARHDHCPHSTRQDLTSSVSTVVFASRCRMVSRHRCRSQGSQGMTGGSAYMYCSECSDAYGLCEVCGQPLKLQATISLAVITQLPDGGYMVTSPYLPEVLTIGEELLATLRSFLVDFNAGLAAYNSKPLPSIPT